MIIYKATNTINNKVYIGKTIKTIDERKYQHHYETLLGRYKSYFITALKKYGFSSFKWEILEECKTENELSLREIYWISFFNSNDRRYGMNMTKGGEGTLGSKRSDSFKRALSERNKLIFTGRKLSLDHRLKIGLKSKGQRCSIDRINKMRIERTGSGNPFYSRKHSVETKAKYSESRKGHLNANSKYVFQLTSPDGIMYNNVLDLVSFCNANSLDVKGVKTAFYTSKSTYKGWKLYRKQKNYINHSI